ncbi:alpha/beta fold hydrolase [Profundibacterium mesophilum]|uniref:Haloalkane dehalogenase n=1 Tax=Profundibacterium mesophilum KAUST100406-0324 TaxID=1037889 RepID=A0A921NT40_9RHOB|nr:alpha/beta hydrolase [Profundibacterium mesophilum]KAF0677462.1 haloalkane dehalogenase [Profundibacterium mesophilum KAUST100406-0324]
MIPKKLASSLLIVALALPGCGLVLENRIERREAAAEAAYPSEGRFVEVAGRRVHYVQEGRGPDLVLIHGASGSTRDFTAGFMERLTDRYRVTAFDRPGLGYSDNVSEAYEGPFNTRSASPAEQAAMLHRAAGMIGIENPIVMGHSYGGAVAMAWGLRHDPAALVIVSGATQPWPGDLGLLYNVTGSSLGGAALVPLLTAFAPEAQVERTIASIFEPQEPPPGYEAHIGAALSLRRASFRTNARQVTGLRPHVTAMSRDYPALRLPVEIVHGTADTIVPIDVHSRPLARQIPGARLTELPGIGHMPHHVSAGAVVAAIDRAARQAGLR